ncbi:hypothetical protein [Palaeococcus ferrophilus]|uniref:hypothetical protein n=1 Tax=Palaeococcus ferrophilus TaxID=83868 RepID=UPI0006500138|nr:hypothetical protein [Palaeococcus ferrophilus]
MGAMDAIGEGIDYLTQERRALVIPGALIGVAYALQVLGEGKNDVGSIFGNLMATELGRGHISEPVSWKLTLVASLLLFVAALFITPYIVERYREFEKGEPIEEGPLVRKALRKMPGVLVAGIAYGIVYLLVFLIALIPLILVTAVIPGLGIALAIILGIPLGLWMAGIAETAIPAYLWTEDLGEGFGLLSTAWENKAEFAVFGLLVFLVSLAGYLVGGIALLIFAFMGAGVVGGFLFGVVMAGLSIVTTVAAIEFFRDVKGYSLNWSGEEALPVEETFINYDPLMGARRY